MVHAVCAKPNSIVAGNAKQTIGRFTERYASQSNVRFMDGAALIIYLIV